MRKVTVHYLFSKNKKIGSRAIAWGTKHRNETKRETPSHIALLINNKWVFESTLETGIRIIGYNEWKTINTEVAKICDNNTHDYSEIKEMFKELKNKKYDWCGVLFLTLCLIPNKLFGTKMPKDNKFAQDHKYFCCEVIGKLLDVDYDMKCPIDIMNDLKGRIL